MATSAYSRGGGGTNFEQKFAATQMPALLAGLPARVLGSDVKLEAIEFQGEDHAVDDLQLTGESPAGGRRTAVIAVRHDPVIDKSDKKFVKLVATMALTLARHRLRDRGQQVIALHAAVISGLGTATDPFGGKLDDILAVAGSRKPRVLIIEGAESGLDQLRHLTSAAHTANHQCVIAGP